MNLVDDLQLALDDRERTRREFLAALGLAAVSMAGLGTSVTAVRFMWPEVLFEAPTRFRVGRPEDIPVGTLVVLPEQRVYLVRDSAGFVAMTAVCTHLGCLTRYEAENNVIFCPCHGSRFATDGAVVNGPAPRPLPRLALTLENGLLVVDTAVVVSRDTVLTV
ncbi:MAG: ubiquinol-cytochrome c reductase iron-sulfur subunit [Acidobacteria bacterium]|nr:ubiquinol-cytochrome c reductase iron-sulfur subunit [Acidobacteriota bacterium]